MTNDLCHQLLEHTKNSETQTLLMQNVSKATETIPPAISAGHIICVSHSILLRLAGCVCVCVSLLPLFIMFFCSISVHGMLSSCLISFVLYVNCSFLLSFSLPLSLLVFAALSPSRSLRKYRPSLHSNVQICCMSSLSIIVFVCVPLPGTMCAAKEKSPFSIYHSDLPELCVFCPSNDISKHEGNAVGDDADARETCDFSNFFSGCGIGEVPPAFVRLEL